MKLVFYQTFLPNSSFLIIFGGFVVGTAFFSARNVTNNQQCAAVESPDTKNDGIRCSAVLVW